MLKFPQFVTALESFLFNAMIDWLSGSIKFDTVKAMHRSKRLAVQNAVRPKSTKQFGKEEIVTLEKLDHNTVQF